MSTRLSYVKCLLCFQGNYRVIYKSTLTSSDFIPKIIQKDLKNTLGNYKKHSRIVKCNNCGFVYSNPMENIKPLLKGYEEVVDDEYLEMEKYRKILSNQHLENLEKYKNKGKILDIGCFAGFFLELAKERNWDTYGIEPSVWARNQAKKRKIKIIGSSAEKTILKKNYFDAVTMWDVIEHVPDPRKILKISYETLKRNGVIAVGTPNIESLVAKILKSNNPYLLRMHLVFFSPTTLGRMLEEEGFKILRTYSYGRTFPLSYILDRIESKNRTFKKIKRIINSNPTVANFPIHLNLNDSFTIIAKK